MRNGYILLHRKGITPEEWKHPERTLAWIDLCTLAAYDDYETEDGVSLRRGEVVASESFLAHRWRQNRGTVHRWLTYWEAQQMVQRVVQHRSQQQPQRLFLVNYAKYQGVPQQVSQQQPQQVPQHRPQVMKRRERESKELNEDRERPRQEKFTDEQVGTMGRDFKRVTVERQWFDQAYADKTWDQSRLLSPDDRREFYRKVVLMLTWSRLPKYAERARTLANEIAGFVNDRGAMERVLSDKELAERRRFAREEGGE